jgi:RNA polymerase sigma-70 factor (ECF subfamily)
MLIVAGDEQLPVAAARAGDSDAWSALFRRYQLPLYVYVVELVHNEQTALDIVQETFVNAARYLPSLRDDRKFGSWLFSIAHQKCQLHWRKPRRDEVQAEEDELDFVVDDARPFDLLIGREQEEEFMAILNQLSETHRSVVLLHFLEEFPLDEIAEVTGVSVGTVKSRLHYAKKELRKLLKAAR